MNPVYTLLIGILLLMLISFLFWPEKGLLARFSKSRSNKQRILIEDTLKHLYDFESRSLKCTLHSIAGHLSVSGDESAHIVERLQEMGLISADNNTFKLTPDGRSYALRVIRIHRLYERYLAEETSTKEINWHLEAEHAEHKITPGQADILAAQLGNPLFDPHGDPIPTSSGEIPKSKSILLSELKNGEYAHVVHIEDEPKAVYAQLIAQGIYAGMQIRTIEVSKERIKLEAYGDEFILAPILAANVSVMKFPEEDKIPDNYKTLASLKIGNEAEVIGISSACRGAQRRRLMDFGVVKGTIIKAELESLGKDPVAYNIRGAKVALRKKQAEQIIIKEIEELKENA